MTNYRWLAKCFETYPLPWRAEVEGTRRCAIFAANGALFMRGVNNGKADMIVEAMNSLARKPNKAARLSKVSGGRISILDAATAEPRNFNQEG